MKRIKKKKKLSPSSSLRFDDVTLTRDGRKKFHIVLGDGETHFVVVRSKNKRKQYFLGFYVKESGILSNDTDGVIGQFIFKEVISVSETILTTSPKGDLQNVVRLSVHRHTPTKRLHLSETSGIMAKRRSSLSKKQVQCIHIRNSGRGILNGSPRDYVLPCLSC
nr:inter-alpha-trypsin inhibitor heavy chain H3-like [Penaeus vannamei]